MSRSRRKASPEVLTPREWVVLALLREGLSNPQIADRLGISLDGAKYHVGEIISKLAVNSRYEAAEWKPEPEGAHGVGALLGFTRAHFRSAVIPMAASVVVVAVVAIALLAWGVIQTGTASIGDRVAVGSATCARGPTPTPPPTLGPDQRRTPRPPDLRPASTRMAEIDGFRKQRYDSTKAIIDSGCDPRNLPMVAITHNDGDFPNTLDGALQRADLVVTAHVTKIRFTIDEGNPIPQAQTMLAVDVMLKGDASQEITLYQTGGPIPDYGGEIGIIEGDPVLLPGDDVLLLAQKTTTSDGYFSVYPVGKYYIRDGAMSVPDGSPCDWLNGRSVSDVLALVRASLSHVTQESAQPCDWTRFK